MWRFGKKSVREREGERERESKALWISVKHSGNCEAERVIFSNSLYDIVAVKCHRKTLLAKDFVPIKFVELKP